MCGGNGERIRAQKKSDGDGGHGRRCAGGDPNRNAPAFYCVPAKAYEALLERLEDLELNATADARAGQKLIKVKLDNEVRDAQLIVVVVVAIGKRNQNEVYKAADQRKID